MKNLFNFLESIKLTYIIGILFVFLVSAFFWNSNETFDIENIESYSFKKNGNNMATQNINNNLSIDISNGTFSLFDNKSNEIQSKYSVQKVAINDESIYLNSNPEFSIEGNKLIEKHNDQLKLNYTNTSKGLRQDFVIEQGPEKDVKFNVELLLETEMQPYQIDQYSIGLKHEINAAKNLQYRDLLVYDANGEFLKCEMTFDQLDSDSYKVNLYAFADEVEYPVTIDPLSTSSSSFESMVDSTYTGFSVIGNCDLNNDGYADAVVSSYGHEVDMLKFVGKFDVFWGDENGVDLDGIPDFTEIGDTAINRPGYKGLGIGQKFGFSIDNAGDVNNDGVDDLIVGAPAISMIDTTGGLNDTIQGMGGFYIYYGDLTPETPDFGENMSVFYGTQDTMSLGRVVSGAGDITGDGIDDVMVSAPNYDPELGQKDFGAVFIYEGRSEMDGGLNPEYVDIIVGEVENERFGSALASLGDLNGDMIDDIIIGAYNYTFEFDTAIGKVEVYYGTNGGTFGDPDFEQIGAHKEAQFGYSVADGRQFDSESLGKEVLIGANNFNPMYSPDVNQGRGVGAVYVYTHTGGVPILSLNTTLFNDVGAAGFGTSVSSAGDVNGGMEDDVIVGAPFYSLNNNNEGAVYGYYGENFEAGEDDSYDWCATGEKSNAFLGIAIDLASTDLAINSIIAGAYGYGIQNTLFQGAAFVYEGSDCGLRKYEEPIFLSFPQDTIFVDAMPDQCGAIVDFDNPDVGKICDSDELSLTSGLSSGDFFPIGINTVNFSITYDGGTVDSSFVILVEDTQSPMPVGCMSVIEIELVGDASEAMISFTPPVFEDNHDCSGNELEVTRLQPMENIIGTMQGPGVYPFVYSATDSTGNIGYCTFRVVIRKIDDTGRQCTNQELTSDLSIDKNTLGNPSSAPNLEFDYPWNSADQVDGNTFGIKILIALFEGISGITLPGFVKQIIGEIGGGIDLAFVSVSFNYLPSIQITPGVFYRLVKDDAAPLNATINYLGEVCSFKAPDKFFGCRDTIGVTTSFIIDDNSTLAVTPAGIRQQLGGSAKDFIFKWVISIDVSACIGIPLCVPFFGCSGDCLGYTASWDASVPIIKPVDIFQELGLGNKIEIPILSVCDDLFRNGANLADAVGCLVGFNDDVLDAIRLLVDASGVDQPISYDDARDEVIFDFNNLPEIGNEIPEMDFKFGRLLSNEMGPTFINGDRLTTCGVENRFFIGRLDLFSLLYYVLPAGTSDLLSCAGITLGTKTIGLGVPGPAQNGACEVSELFSIDVLDVNVSLRSDLKVDYEFTPDVEVEGMRFTTGDGTAEERDLLPLFAKRSMDTEYQLVDELNGIQLDEEIKIVVADNSTDIFYLDNEFSINGKLSGRAYRQNNLDVDIKAFEFFPTDLVPLTLGPLVSIDVASEPVGSPANIYVYDENQMFDPIFASVTMVPDDLPPVTFCRDTTLIFDEFGNAFLGDPSLYLDASSYDEPIGGTGTVIPVDVFPDTLYCTDYPSIIASLVTRDDNCNFDTCEFTVTLLDITPPQLGCVDITVGIGENGTYTMNPDEVIIGSVDNCNNIIPTITPSTLTCDDVGSPVEVMIVVEDIAGNVDSCAVMVTVVDTFLLQIECPFLPPYPVTRSTSTINCRYIPDMDEFRPTVVAPDCSTMVTYGLTGATTGTGMSNVGGVPFELGETTVTYTATDASGNTTSCSFKVIIEDTVDPIMNCPLSVEISTNDDGMNDYNCTTDYTWNHPNPSDNCSIIAYELLITNPDGSTETEDLKAIYDSSILSVTRNFDLGITELKYTALDTMSNMVMCSFTVNVIDDESPMIFCEDVTATNVFTLEGNVNIEPNDVSTATINVPVSMSITGFSISEFDVTAPVVGNLSFSLTSPQGTTVVLGAGGSPFDGEDSFGDWILTMTSNSIFECGVLTDWGLEITGSDNTTMGESVIELVTDAGACSYTISDTGFDPTFNDNCGATAAHNGTTGPFSNTLNGYELPLGETIIEWVVTDPAGNADTCELTFVVLDNIAPTFLNCPMPDVVENAEFGECGAFANMSLPIAQDNCGVVDVVQVDNTGLSPGSIFPVGTTVLEYEATDEAGNTARCSVRVIINDTQIGTFACSDDVERVNDLWECSAVVLGIPPVGIEDNCINNVSINYQIEYPAGSGNIVAAGVEDASGETFDQGTSTVYYTMFNEPILLITEVTQELLSAEGGMDANPFATLTNDDYLEITNLGPADYNVTGLIIERFGAYFNDVFEVPNTTIIPSGMTLVLHFGNGEDDAANLFFNMPCAIDIPSDEPAGYVIAFKDRVIDVTSTNGYNPIGQSISATISGADWTGTTGDSENTGGIIRRFSFDNDEAADWQIAENCNALTIGMVNPEVQTYTSNGSITALQSIQPEIVECSFNVTISDVEPPMCMERIDPNTYVGPAVTAIAGECNQSIISIPDTEDCILTEINVSIQGMISLTENAVISVISPQGDTLILYDRSCTGSATLDVTFDDEAEDAASTLCDSADWNGSVRPQTEMLMKFYTSKLAGDWILLVDIDPMSNAIADITSWSLEATCMTDYDMANVEIENDLGVCAAEFTWIHPFTVDNCLVSSISVEYSSDDSELEVPTGSILTDNFGKGGFEVTETFSVGMTRVLYTLTDASNNESQCEFNVVVLDTEDPIITFCPNNILVGLEGGECSEVVDYIVEAEDNCEVASIIGTPSSGSYFDIGTTTVEVIVTDLAGNTAVCTFDVIVFEFDPDSNTFACNNAINMSLDSNCEAVINADAILEGNEYGCYDNYCITVTTLTGVPHDNYFDATDINETFNVTVSDCSGDIEYSCWGTVTIEEKFDPEIECPVDVTIFCNEDQDEIDSQTGLLVTGEAVLLNCEPGAEFTYEDNITDFGECSNPRMLITRTWIVIDADGNEAQCNQEITIAAVDYASIIFPEDLDLDTALECEDVSADESLLTPENTGYPTLNGQNITEAGSLCMISKNVSDEIYDICNGSYEILRTWKLRNMCEPLSVTNPLTHTQIIKVLDTSAPKFAVCPSDTIMSVAPLNCVGNGFLAVPQSINDLCGEVVFDANIYGGGTLEITGTVADNNLSVFASNMRKGDHRIEYTAEDDCGNISECSFIVTVVDITPPVVVVKQNVIVNLSTNGDPDSGAAKLFVGSVDQGSFDGCTAVRVEIRRESDNCGISGNTTFNADGHPTDGSPNPNAANYDSDDGQSVMFCCEDIPDGEVEAVVKVIVRVWDDGNDTGFFGDGVDLNGDGDTLDPGEYDNYNESWVDVTVEQKDVPSLACPSDITLACDMDYTDPNLRGTAISSSLCGSVMIDVTYTPQLNACGLGFVIATYSVASTPSVTCSQRITLENPYPTFAENSIKYPRDLPTSPTGQLSCQDDIPFDEPTWTAGPCDFIGYTEEVDTFFFELDPDTGLPVDECFNIVRSFTVIDWCVYDATNGEEGTYFGSQTITITDNEAPVLLECEPTMYEVDADCVRTSTDLTNMAEDNGDCASDWLKWQVFVDTWADGVVDYEYSSFLATNTNFNTDSNNNGVVDKFLAPTMSGEQVSVTVSEVLEASSFNHIVTWKVTDGCGNVASCETTFMVVDKKAPTPNCVNLSSAPMPSTNTVELWAIDYDLGATDNCTAQENLRFTFSNTSPENDPNYDPAQRSSAMTFTAPEDCGLQPIDVYVWDEAGNVDFCTVTLLLSGEGCPDSGNRVIAGTSVTEAGNGVSEAQVILEAEIAEYPLTQMTTEEGGFAFTENPDAIDYSLRVQKNDNHTNGVSTLDLVLIQRHVVGFQEFDSPYKVIASDISNDENVSAIDIVELRKVILGIQDEFSNNTSWRFIDATQQFSDIGDPFPIDEERDIDNLSNEMLNEDFIAIKIGDVNASATFNVTGAIAEVRNRENLKFEYEDRFVKAGELVSITLNSTEFKDISGFQLTMEFDGLSYSGVESKSIDVAEYNVGQIKSDIITMSWSNTTMKTTATDELFVINVIAEEGGYLSDMIKISDSVISTEIYQGTTYNIKGIELDVRSDRLLVEQIELLQNEPNPFKGKTTIAFYLPTKSAITLTITDVSGKLLKIIEGEYEVGNNGVVLLSSELGVSGVLFYTLETEGFSETKKMILID